MHKAVASRKAIYRFLYAQRVENPKTYLGNEDLVPLAAKGQLDAVLSFALEMGHVERYQKKYVRMTALGMLFSEQYGYVEDEDGD